MDFDFLVIGGGIAGTSVGAALSSLGSVCLWERESALGYHASGRSAALFAEDYGVAEVTTLNRASWSTHEAMGYATPRGILVVGTPAQSDALARDIAAFSLTPLTPTEAVAYVPILNPAALHGAGYSAAAYDLDTDRMLQDGARAIRAAGGRVETDRAVTVIIRLADSWRVSAGETVVTARTLVNAAGAWADRLAERSGIAPVGLAPLRRSCARLAAPAGLPTASYPMLIGAGESWYAKPDAGALLVSPAEEDLSVPMDAFADDLALAEGLARYQEVVTPVVTRPIATWAGLRTFAQDRRPVLGPDPADPSFIWCAGQGGFGFQTAPAVARLLADLVGGRAPELDAATISAFSSERFS
jgi:glycine/D-amino acid oxidase-like deaminating enzyme